MFTPIKSATVNVLNDTVLNTPLPQASSTVRRRSTQGAKFSNRNANEEIRNKDVQSKNEITCRETESSLGLLDNMSVLTSISAMEDEQKSTCPNEDADLEYARKLLRKCSDSKNSSPTEMNKENDANVQNIADGLLGSNFTLPNQNYMSGLDKDQECGISRLMSKASIASDTFEPTEITARSSGISSTKKHSPLSRFAASGINFSASEIMAQRNNEIMAQFNDEEFLSSSKMAEQLSVDEARWQQQDCTFSIPVMGAEKQKLDFSAFSGIIGQMDLSVESCAGRKISVGEYFARKSGNIGNLMENDEKARPNLGFPTKTPIRTAPLQPLIESTIANSTLSSTEPRDSTFVPSAASNIDRDSVIRLSTIVNILQDANSETPRRLIDELLMAQKKKRQTTIQGNARKDTYTLDCDGKSITSSGSFNKFDNNDITSELTTAKLSLDSRIQNETRNEIVDFKQEYSTLSSFNSGRDVKEAESFMNACKENMLKEETSNVNASLFNQDAGICKSRVLSHVPHKQSRNYNDDSYGYLNIQKEEVIRKKDTSNNTIDLSLSDNVNAEMQSDLNCSINNVVIGRNTERLCNCIVGMTRRADVELVNNGDRWIKYFLKLVEVEDRQNIELSIPQDPVLIKPNGVQSTKIEVKITKICKPIFVVLNIILSDMVTKSHWFMKHMIFVNPEEVQLEIICDSHKEELDFKYVGEKSPKTLPITFHNKNSIAVPVKFSVTHDGPRIFSIESTYDKPDVNPSRSRDEWTHLVLNSNEKVTVNVKCDGLQVTSVETQRPQPQYWKGKLIVHVACDDDIVLLKREVPLYAQTGVCKIDVVDTELPIVVPRQQGKLLNIVNSGNVATHVSASVVSSYPNTTQDFCVKPENMFLEPGENASFLIVYKPQYLDAKADSERYAKIKLVAGNNVYYHVICTEAKLEHERESHLRCHTPNNVVSLSPATSPQSVTSTRSEPDRNSPISVVSSVAVAGNTIPIRATHAALVWNSVKIGKSEIKELTIRNTSGNKIKIQIDLLDTKKSFKFLSDRQTTTRQTTTSMVLAMQRQEIKTLSVVFSPYYVGPVVGKITIKHYTRESSDSQQHKKIPLYGYGGCGKMKVTDTFKDADGKMWLTFGTLSSETAVLTTNFTLQNVGDLRSFAKIKVVPKVISPTMDSSWHVNPKELILNPKEQQQVSIEFSPKREDYAVLQRSEVSHVATISVTYGDEPTRWRIRRLYNKIKESGVPSENENEAFKSIVHPICRTFPKEQMPPLTSICDTIQNLSDLCTGVHQYEIMLTVEVCADDTLPVHYDTDESQLYYSLISDTTNIDEAAGASFFASPMMAECEAQRSELGEEQLVASPSIVVLNPPVRNEATVTVLSYFRAAQPFQASVSDSNYFRVVPAEGMLPSRRGFPLRVTCLQRMERNMQAVLEIYTANNKQDVPINVIVKRQ